jgi:hypothetical protein
MHSVEPKSSLPSNWKILSFIGVALALATMLAIRDLSREELPLVELPPEVLRLQGMNGNAAGVLEVPLIRYEGIDGGGAPGVKLDFIGAVHIGDESYYRELNRRFEGYEGVLYELVAEPARIRELNKQDASSGLGWVQKRLSDLMGLSFQLELIDYHAPNLVHADLSPTQLHAAMKARGESVFELLWKMLTVPMDPKFKQRAKEIEGSSESLKGLNPLVVLLRGPTDREKLLIKRFMARGMLGSESFIKTMEGDHGIALIQDRNKAVVEAVHREVGAGKRHLAIFYGAGHLTDLHERLSKDLGFRIVAVEWLPAWRIPALDHPASSDSNR